MNKTVNIVISFFLGFSMCAHSVAENRCLGLLQDGVRNQLSENYSNKFLRDFHSAMCSEKQDRIEKAKNQGFGLEYDEFVFDFAGDNKKIASYQESMCSEDNELNTRDTFYEIVKNHIDPKITSDYVECIRISEGGLLYSIKEGSEGDSITIDVEYSRRRAPQAFVSITDVVISPEHLEKSVSCKGSLANVSPGSPVKLNQTVGVKSITCRPGKEFPKVGDKDFTVTLHTDAGSINGYVHPYHKGKSDRLASMEQKFTNITNQNTNRINSYESKSGIVKQGGKVKVPWGTTNDWNIIVSPVKLGGWETKKGEKPNSTTSKKWSLDNQIIEIDFNVTLSPDKKSWVVTAKQAYKQGETLNKNVHPPHGTKAHYIITPKKI